MSNEELVALIQSGERDHLLELWEQVQAFAVQRAKRRMILTDGYGGVTFDDLYNSGYVALAAAVESYDSAQGMSFIGWYAYALKTAFAEAGGYLGRKQAGDPIHTAGSLDAPISGEDEAADLIDIVADPTAADALEAVEDSIYTQQLHEALDAAIARLPADGSELIRTIYYGGNKQSDIAAERGVSKQSIARKKQECLARLRRPDCMKYLRGFVEDCTPWEWCSGVHVVEQIAVERERLAERYIHGIYDAAKNI